MTESWFHRMEDDVRHAASRFHRHGDTIGAVETQAPLSPGAPMALADTSNSLKDNSGQIRIGLQDGLAKLHDVLDNHMAQLDTAIGDVADVAAIADHPLVVAAAGALHVPAPVLEGFIGGLNALASAFPKHEEAPVAPEVPAEPEQPAEQQAA